MPVRVWSSYLHYKKEVEKSWSLRLGLLVLYICFFYVCMLRLRNGSSRLSGAGSSPLPFCMPFRNNKYYDYPQRCPLISAGLALWALRGWPHPPCVTDTTRSNSTSNSPSGASEPQPGDFLFFLDSFFYVRFFWNPTITSRPLITSRMSEASSQLAGLVVFGLPHQNIRASRHQGITYW